MMMRRKFSLAGVGLFVGLTMLSSQAYAKQPMAISIIGNGPAGGSTNISCTHTIDSLCPSTSCWCNTANGTAKTSLAGLDGATFSADTAIDLSSGSTVGNCQQTEGRVTITSKNLKNSLVLDYSGLACIFNDVTITMTYVVNSGLSTGKFAGVTGTGSITGSEDPTNGNILGNVNGNILFP
jgi:hypothetical protein